MSTPPERQRPAREFSVAEAARLLGANPRSIRDWIQCGRFAARREGRRYFLSDAFVRSLKAHEERVRKWPRLVDVSRRFGIHRNHGASLCRVAGFSIEKDLTDDCRIPPEAEAWLAERMKAEAARRDWVPLVALAKQLGVPRNVLDGGIRKHGLAFAKDYTRQVVVPPATVEWLCGWRRKLDGYRSEATEAGDRRLHPIHATAAKAAEKFAKRGDDAHAKKTQALIHRYRYWAKEGMPVARMDRQLFVDEATHDALVDDVSPIEASRLTGIKIGRLKRWAAKGIVQQTKVAPTRRSLSFSSVLAAAAACVKEGRTVHGVPVQMLLPWPELIGRLCPPGAVSLERMLELSADATPRDIGALVSGAGFVSRAVWRILDDWLRAREAGRLPPKPPMTTQQHRDALTRAPELPFLLGWFSGIRDAHFAAVLRPGLRNQVNGDELTALCGHLTAGTPVRVYEPERAYRTGEFLVDSNGEDLGAVRAAHPSHIEVEWMRRGALKMSHHATNGPG